MKTNIMTKFANFTKKTIDRTAASLKDMKEIYDDLPQETKDGCKLTVLACLLPAALHTRRIRNLAWLCMGALSQCMLPP